MLETYILKIDKDLSKDDFEKLLGFVSEVKRERILRFHKFKDAQRSLLGAVLARYSISKRLGVKNKDLIFGANEYGKPILLAPSEIHFNISHSENWVVCAVDKSLVGIDVETIRPIDFKIAERYFSKDEYKALLSQPEEMRLKYFYMIWTLKESYIKAEGTGLSIPLDSFSMKIDDYVVSCITANGNTGYSFYLTFLEHTAVCAVCNMSRNYTREVSWGIKKFMQEVTRSLI